MNNKSIQIPALRPDSNANSAHKSDVGDKAGHQPIGPNKSNAGLNTASDPLARIAAQVDHLIMPDFAPLILLVRERLEEAAKQKNALILEAAQVRGDAMSAATSLMLLHGGAQWQIGSLNHFDRVALLRLEDKGKKK